MSRKFFSRLILIIALVLGFSVVARAEDVAVVYLGEGQEGIKSTLERGLQQILPQIKVQFISYQEPETKQIIQQYNLRFLPFVSLSKGIVDSANFINLVRSGTIEKTGNLLYISPQALKPYGLYIVGSQKLPHQLDIYTGSICPYGQPALRELINLISNENLDVSLQVRFITTFRDYGVDSLGGPEEIKEDIRQLIIQKDYPDKFFDYILARQVMSLEDTLTANGLVDPLATQAKEQEGLGMLSQDAQLTVAYNITSSPTFFWENQYLYFSWQDFKPVISRLLEAEQKKEEVEKEEPKKKKGWFFGR